MVKATGLAKAEKKQKNTDQELPLTGQCALEPACFVRSRWSQGARLTPTAALPTTGLLLRRPSGPILRRP